MKYTMRSYASRSLAITIVLVAAAAVSSQAQQGLPIPLREGLTIVTAINHPKEGDYETLKTVTRADSREVSIRANAMRTVVVRTVSREDLESGRHYQYYFGNNANTPERFPGSTAVGLSSTILAELKDKGESAFTIQDVGLVRDVRNLGLKLSGSLKRVESSSVPFKVIVNNVPVELSAIHAKGTFGSQEAEFWILDDRENPLSLNWNIGERKLQVIRLAFPAPAADRIEKALREEGRTVVYGIYFDFGSDRIKEESEPVLKEIADVMVKNPTWRLSVEGHTDSIGDDEANLLLSQRRAAAVRKVLGDRYTIAPARLEPTGFGKTRPKGTNETLEGRALNRRVELVRVGNDPRSSQAER